MNNGLTERVLMIHRPPSQHVDGIIRLNGKAYTFTYCRKESLLGRKMTVWVREAPYDWMSLSERLIVYNSYVANDDTFIGCADWRPRSTEDAEGEFGVVNQ